VLLRGRRVLKGVREGCCSEGNQGRKQKRTHCT
jgi:hypothetical protein